MLMAAPSEHSSASRGLGPTSGSPPEPDLLYRAGLGLDDRSRVFGNKRFIWSLRDFVWSAAVVQINVKVQEGRGSEGGFTGLAGREARSKCSCENAAPGFRLLGYSWPQLMMIDEI